MLRVSAHMLIGFSSNMMNWHIAIFCLLFRQALWKLGKLFQTPSSKRLALPIVFCVRTQSALLFPSRCEATLSCGSCPAKQPAPSLPLSKQRQTQCLSAGRHLADLTPSTQKQMSQAVVAACGTTSMEKSKRSKLGTCHKYQTGLLALRLRRCDQCDAAVILCIWPRPLELYVIKSSL